MHTVIHIPATQAKTFGQNMVEAGIWNIKRIKWKVGNPEGLWTVEQLFVQLCLTCQDPHHYPTLEEAGFSAYLSYILQSVEHVYIKLHQLLPSQSATRNIVLLCFFFCVCCFFVLVCFGGFCLFVCFFGLPLWNLITQVLPVFCCSTGQASRKDTDISDFN